MAQEYKRRRDELEDLAAQEREEVLERSEKPLRVGAMSRCKRCKNGRHFFDGDVCHVAVYLSTLSVDTVRSHHFAGVEATSLVCDRLYALAGAKFQASLAFAPDDNEIITRYAQSIINYLELESMQVGNAMNFVHSVTSAMVDVSPRRIVLLSCQRMLTRTMYVYHFDFQSKNPRRSQNIVEEAVDMFIQMENWNGLAVVFVQLPSGTSLR